MHTLHLNEVIPPDAHAVRLKWQITPASGGVLLYRTPTDTEPQGLYGHSGEAITAVVVPQTLYYELLPGTTHFDVVVTGHQTPSDP